MSSTNSAARRPRHIDDSPFCWESKVALRKLREGLDSTNAVASGIAVYTALCEIASDEQAQVFTTTQAFIALRCGLAVRTVRSRLKDLEDLGLLLVHVPALKAPARYTLLTTGTQGPPSGNGCPTFGNGRKKAHLPRSKESPEESPEEAKSKNRTELW